MSNNEMKVTGTIFKIGDVIENDACSWKKIELIVEVKKSWGEGTEFWKFEMGNKPDAQHDNVANLAKYNKVGQVVDVDFNINVFSWASKRADNLGEIQYGTSLRAWKVFKSEESQIEVADVPVMGMSDEEPPF
tara:strand:- start:725 stop:1123 length:399 start_codon:yes stop_codon:yes gene_type:complete